MTTSMQDPTLSKVTSRDGTEIGYWSSGEGPALVLVHGLLGDHSRWAAMLPYLEPHFTVHAMDRRGRGASGDHPDYDIAREFEDVAAVVDAVAEAAGTSVDVLGSSGGAAYAIAAASLTPSIRRLVLFEPPTATVVSLLPASLTDRMDDLLAAGEREAVIEMAYRAVVGLSDAEIEHLRNQPAWSSRVAAAHTVPRELRSPPDRIFDPEQAARVTVPALVLAGGASPQPFQDSARIVADTLPNARVAALDAQGHGAAMLAPEIVAARVVDFLTGQVRGHEQP
jgi:pimeloyl-ACP methyl ester carboxylesterase